MTANPNPFALMNWFRRRVIGGETGVTEGAWFIFWVWVGFGVGLTVLHILGYDVAKIGDRWFDLVDWVGGIWVGAHGMKNSRVAWMGGKQEPGVD